MGFDLNLICIFFLVYLGLVFLLPSYYCLGFFCFAWLDESQWEPESQNESS